MVSPLSRIWQKLTMNATSNVITLVIAITLGWTESPETPSPQNGSHYHARLLWLCAKPCQGTAHQGEAKWWAVVCEHTLSWCLLVMSFNLLPLQLLGINSIRSTLQLLVFFLGVSCILVQKLSLPITLLVFGKVVGEEESPQRREQRVSCGFNPHVPCLHCRRVPWCIMHRPAIRPTRTHLVLHFIAPDPFWSCFLWLGAFLLI